MRSRCVSYRAFALLTSLASLSLVACSDSSSSGVDSGGGTLKMQLALGSGKAPAPGGTRNSALRASPLAAVGVESLKYYISSIQICEQMDVSGSGFQNQSGCLSVYEGDHTEFAYDTMGTDWTPLADRARMTDRGFIDMLDATSRSALAASTRLTREHVRTYSYGMITWALPIKVKASAVTPTGTVLYTHDGRTVMQIVGADNFRNYFTEPSRPLTDGPAEEAVVLLGNGGNWFKFQSPLAITEEDINERRAWVLDLVFNPEGIVKALDGASNGQISERNSEGTFTRSMTVPMLDLAPVPHRSTETVIRESYIGRVATTANAFDLRVELYSVDGDPARAVYGVDIKTLVSSATTQRVPEINKVSFVEASGSALQFLSFKRTPFLTGFQRGSVEGDTTTARITCSSHADREAASGGAAIITDDCPGATIDVPFTLISRNVVTGSTSIGVGDPDASVPDGGDGG